MGRLGMVTKTAGSLSQTLLLDLKWTPGCLASHHIPLVEVERS